MDYKADLSPEQKLDIVLQRVVNLSETDNLTYAFIANLIGASDYKKEVFEILLKLLKDGYVTSPQGGGHGYYYSNFDGRLFIDNGGYTAKSLADAADAEEQRLEIDRLRSVDFSSDRNQRILNKLTRRLVWATWFAFVAALLVVIWQFFLWINPTYSNFPYILFGIVRK